MKACQLRRRRKEGWGAGGLQPSQLCKNLQKSAVIGQKIGLKSGKILVNNGSFIGQPLSVDFIPSRSYLSFGPTLRMGGWKLSIIVALMFV